MNPYLYAVTSLFMHTHVCVPLSQKAMPEVRFTYFQVFLNLRGLFLKIISSKMGGGGAHL